MPPDGREGSSQWLVKAARAGWAGLLLRGIGSDTLGWLIEGELLMTLQSLAF
jgi:hypothetical protein